MKSGSKVKIIDLKSEEGLKLNGLEGVVDHFAHTRGRYAVSLPGKPDLKMVKEANLELLAEPESKEAVFSDEAEMMARLKGMGMPDHMLKDLTPAQKKVMFEMSQRQDIVEQAKKAAGIDSNELAELKEAAGGLYSWRDASDHVDLEVKCEGVDTKDIKCDVKEQFIHISVGGKDVLKGNLFQRIIPAVSKSEITADGVLVVKLQKLSKMRWLMVVR